jgi:hypothetical protein
LERDSLSSEGFLRRGERKDSLKWVGRRPEAREWLIIEVIVGMRREAHSLRRAVGMGSRSHCLLGDWWSSLATSDSVAGEKEESSEEIGGGTTEWGEEDVGLDLREKWSLVILSEKKLAKVWARERDELGEEDGGGWDWLRWSRVLAVCQRRRGLDELDLIRSEK